MSDQPTPEPDDPNVPDDANTSITGMDTSFNFVVVGVQT
jgi:hypothetical protein